MSRQLEIPGCILDVPCAHLEDWWNLTFVSGFIRPFPRVPLWWVGCWVGWWLGGDGGIEVWVASPWGFYLQQYAEG